MNAWWNWLLLQLAAQLFVGIFHWRLVGKGRILTRPLWRFRPFRPPVSRLSGRPVYSVVRTKQIIVLAIVELPTAFLMDTPYLSPIGATILVSLYLDDYFTGDDDRWKRFKDAVRNAIKWKMRLPIIQEGMR